MARVGSATATGLEGLIKALEAFPGEAEKAITRGMLRSEEQILGESRGIVPVATGELRGSAQAPLPQRDSKGISVEFGYYAPYAYVTHQNPRAGHTQGVSPSGRRYPAGTWAAHGDPFFLSEPFKRHIEGGRFNANLKTELTAALKRTVGKKHS